MTTCYFPSRNKSYYPIASEQKEEFKNLLKVIESVQGVLSEDEESYELQNKGLAFFIAATQALDPQNWKTTLANLKGRIIQIKTEKGQQAPLETSWLLAQLITNLYKTSLMDKHSVSQGEASRNIELYLEICEMNSELDADSYKQQKQIIFGGILEEYVPDWYKS